MSKRNVEVLNPIPSMTTGERVKLYFRTKAKQILTVADLSVCGHAGLTGSHREELQRLYFREILPKRYEVGRGVVFGYSGHSRESDIVIWDSFDFPSLPISDHAFYFSESVRCVIECKSRYSSEEFADVLEKSDAVMGIFSYPDFGIREQVASIQQEIVSIREGIAHDGALIIPARIATAAIFLTGGQLFSDEIAKLYQMDIDKKWPDILLFLEPGYVVVKAYEAAGGMAGSGKLLFYKIADDALLLFTHELLMRITERTDAIHPPLQILRYVREFAKIAPDSEYEFPLVMGVPQRTPLWR